MFGCVGLAEITAPALDDARVRRLVGVMSLREDANFSARFPVERWARIRIVLADGRTLHSQPARTRGDPDTPLDGDELRDKYHAMSNPVLGEARAKRIESLIDDFADDDGNTAMLLDELLRPGTYQPTT